MSWHYSQALVEDYSGVRSLGGLLFAPSKSTNLKEIDSCKDKTKDTYHRSRYGMTFAPSRANNGGELLRLFQAGSHAQTLVQPVKVQGSTVKNQDYGLKWGESFARLNLSTYTWKTPQGSLIGDSIEYLQTFPRWGLLLDGACWDQSMLAVSIGGKESGLWPTPCRGSSHWGGTFQEVGGSKNKLRNTPLGKLYVNPDFWENLMGWPIGWTGIEPLETDKTHLFSRKHGGY